MKNITRSTREIQQPVSTGAEELIREGWAMAAKEGEPSFESIEIARAAEIKAAEVEAKHIQATGQLTLQLRDTVQARLQGLGFSVAEHLHQIARGKVDLIQAIGLLAVSAALALFVLLAFGPGEYALP